MTITLSAPLLALLLSATQDTHELTFGVPEGMALHRAWTARHVLLLEKFERQYAGEDKAQTMDVSMRLESEHVVEVVDEYRRVASGRPTELRRSFLDARIQAKQQPVDEPTLVREAKLTSPFTGASVVFTWIEDEDAYGRYYDGPELTEAWLPRVRQDLDLTALLPGRPAAVGDTWSVGPRVLHDVLAPCGDLHLEAEDGSDRLMQRSLRVGIGGTLDVAFGGQSTGEVRVELDKVEGGIATLALSLVDLRYLQDITDYSEENRLRVEEEAGVARTTGKLVLELSGSGTLAWDLAAGRPKELALVLSERVRVSVILEGGEAGTQSYEDRMTMSGKLEVGYTVTEATEAPAPPPGPQDK